MSKTDGSYTDTKTKRKRSPGDSKLLEPFSRWTNEDDARLLAQVDMKDDVSWGKIAKHFPNKTATACQARWEELIKRDGKKGNWTVAEDELLRQWV